VRLRLVRLTAVNRGRLALRGGGRGGLGSRRPLVAKRDLRWLPNWIALHAERGPLLKCWEGHRLLAVPADGRRYGACVKCGRQPPPGSRILACRACAWSVCPSCAERPRLPRLQDDPLFHGPDSPCLLLPPGSPAMVPGAGTVIICPGGNYEFLCPHEAVPVAEWLRGQGINAMVLRYRLLPSYDLQDALQDLTGAVAAARRAEGGGPVAAIGFSAGGHLIASLALNRRARHSVRRQRLLLDAQVLVYPAVDGSGWLRPDEHGFFDAEACLPRVPSLLVGQKALLGGPGFRAPPTFLVASTRDGVCPPREHSDVYAKALERRGVQHTYLRRDFGDHGFGLDAGWTGRCIAWLRTQGFGGSTALGGA